MKQAFFFSVLLSNRKDLVPWTQVNREPLDALTDVNFTAQLATLVLTSTKPVAFDYLDEIV